MSSLTHNEVFAFSLPQIQPDSHLAHVVMRATFGIVTPVLSSLYLRARHMSRPLPYLRDSTLQL